MVCIMGISVVGCKSTSPQRGSSTILPIRTTPTGATVQTNGVTVGVSPLDIVLPRMIGREGLVIKIICDGYEPVLTTVVSRLSMEGFVFLFPRLPMAMILDVPAGPKGSSLDLIPRSIDISMTPVSLPHVE